MENTQSPKYKYMILLQKVYKVPILLLHDRTISLLRRKFLLKKWRDERTAYLYENCRDYDYLQDKQITLLLACVNKIKRRPDHYS
jgi:hypothetical protein